MKSTPVTLRYLKSEYKRAFLSLPKLLGGAVFFFALLFLLIGLIARSLYQSGQIPMTQIAVVNEDASVDTGLALSYLEGFRSASSFFTFTEASKEEADSLLATHKVIAVITVPSGTIESILNGTNQAVSVTFSYTEGLPAALLAELTRSGASMLGSAQGAIYAAADLYTRYDLAVDLQSVFDTLNNRNMRTVMMRENLFRAESSSVTGSASVPVFYGATLLFLLFLACGTLYHVQFSENSSVHTIWAQMSLSSFSRIFVKLLVVLTQNFLIGFLLALLLQTPVASSVLPDAASFFFIIGILFVPLLFFSCFEVLCYMLPKKKTDGILWLFFTGLLLAFSSGILLPEAFLPDFMKKFSTLLPPYWCHRIFITILDKDQTLYKRYSLFCIVGAILLLLFTVLFSSHKRRNIT